MDPEEVEPLSRMECPGWSFVAWTVIELRRKSDMVVECSAEPEIRIILCIVLSLDAKGRQSARM